MKLGKYTIDIDVILNKINEKFFSVNSKKYWDGRFKRDWSKSGGDVQTAVFSGGFVLNVNNIDLDEVSTVLDYGCGTGDSAPFLKMKFPDADIYLWDFSNSAREMASEKYLDVAEVLSIEPSKSYDLVYCSNVVEHIDDIDGFLKLLTEVVNTYLVIQAPYNELHVNGDSLTPLNPLGEHVRTIGHDFLHNEILKENFDWNTKEFFVPFAWKKGKQILMVGRKK